MMVARAALSSPSGAWPITGKFLYTHCEDIRDIMKAYDVGFSLGAGQALGQARDKPLSKRVSACFLDCLPHNKSHDSG